MTITNNLASQENLEDYVVIIQAAILSRQQFVTQSVSYNRQAKIHLLYFAFISLASIQPADSNIATLIEGATI